MGTARPFILGVRGEAEEILSAAGAGIAIPPEDAGVLAPAITMLADDPQQCVRTGIAGRRFVETHYNRDHLAETMLAVLEKVAEKGAVPFMNRALERSQ